MWVKSTESNEDIKGVGLGGDGCTRCKVHVRVLHTWRDMQWGIYKVWQFLAIISFFFLY